MESIHQIILEAVSGGFWHFVGCAIMCGIIFVAPLAAALSIVEKSISRKKD